MCFKICINICSKGQVDDDEDDISDFGKTRPTANVKDEGHHDHIQAPPVINKIDIHAAGIDKKSETAIGNNNYAGGDNRLGVGEPQREE
ncbi:uncharacterized protein A4U43_C09F530 [Asparagus officinalis]|uniref:Uncharacterized protein n=1 Tax=Asparagus officinalis TaxID=4686 RepID=A0A5P1E4N9_ASPOF|nr:uncharacterized protein A4U43_C09F530 [Asparagus officinalis]